MEDKAMSKRMAWTIILIGSVITIILKVLMMAKG
ncbi:hypothetical protein LABO110987_01625 [Lactobacillus bombicola]